MSDYVVRQWTRHVFKVEAASKKEAIQKVHEDPGAYEKGFDGYRKATAKRAP